ncbi:TPA: hypothetical protein ACGHLA_000582 [Salmonella enterica subsp. enterica serovar Bovismorbificans]
MPRNKSPRKRKQHKPGKPGRSPADGRIPYRRYPKRFMVSVPPEHDHETPHEFFYDSTEEAIQHCVRLGPQFFLDTQYYPPLVTVIRGFEQHPGDAEKAGYSCTDGAMTESIPADEFITGQELGLIPVSFAPWDKLTDNWADNIDNIIRDCDCDCDCWQYVDFRFTGKIPGL